MSTTTDLSTLKINYLTKSQYDTAKAQGLIESNEIYMTPEDSLLRSKVGAIVAYAGSDEPLGWLKCDGRAVSRIDYAELYEVIGTTYGSGDGSTTFNIPDLENRVIVGAGDDYDLNDMGGAPTVTLDVTQIPAHRHDIALYNSAYSQQSVYRDCITTNAWENKWSGVGDYMDNVGGGQAHENMPPYIAINFLICYENHSIGGSGSGGPVDSTDIPTATKIAEFDDDAHINSTDMTTQEVDDFIDELDNLTIVYDDSIVIESFQISSITISANGTYTNTSIDVSSHVPSGYKLVDVECRATGGNEVYCYQVGKYGDTTAVLQLRNNTSSSVTVTPMLKTICVNQKYASVGTKQADYIIEQGTSGSWNYAKWNSGKYECWCTDSQSWADTTSLGSLYYGQKTFNISALGFTAVQNIQVTGNAAGYYVCTKIESYSTSSLILTALSAVSDTRTIVHNIYIVGTWK